MGFGLVCFCESCESSSIVEVWLSVVVIYIVDSELWLVLPVHVGMSHGIV